MTYFQIFLLIGTILFISYIILLNCLYFSKSKNKSQTSFVHVITNTCAYVEIPGLEEFLKKYSELVILMEAYHRYEDTVGYYFILHNTKLYEDYCIDRKE